MLQLTDLGFETIGDLALGQPVRSFIHTGKVKDGTEIAALTLDRPTPNVRYPVFRMIMDVAIRHAAGPRGQDRTALVELIENLIAEVECVMIEIYSVLS